VVGSNGPGLNGAGTGVDGTCTGVGVGVRGTCQRGGIGVVGTTLAIGGSIGVYGTSKAATKFAVVADGDLVVMNGNKYGCFIDHPLDPENRYLLHTPVESSERKNVYDGIAWLNEDGASWAELPDWFEALNGDFRYQLTPVGGSAPGLHVAEEVSENRFKIAGGDEGMKVCWQVTGSRKDRWAAANPLEVEREKREAERGRYLDPSLYDAPEEQKVPMLQAASTSPTGEEAE
jgi:hypothetical protein